MRAKASCVSGMLSSLMLSLLGPGRGLTVLSLSFQNIHVLSYISIIFNSFVFIRFRLMPSFLKKKINMSN